MAKLCAKGKAAAKRKFDVYPSATQTCTQVLCAAARSSPEERRRRKQVDLLAEGAALHGAAWVR